MTTPTGAPTVEIIESSAVTVLSFRRPGPFINMNDRGSWKTRWRLIKAWRQAAGIAAVTIGPPSTRTRKGSWVQLELPVHDARRRDPHNLTPTLKACVDGLVDAGMWPDDNSRFVTTLEPILARRDRGDVTVRIAITPRNLRPFWSLDPHPEGTTP